MSIATEIKLKIPKLIKICSKSAIRFWKIWLSVYKATQYLLSHSLRTTKYATCGFSNAIYCVHMRTYLKGGWGFLKRFGWFFPNSIRNDKS